MFLFSRDNISLVQNILDIKALTKLVTANLLILTMLGCSIPGSFQSREINIDLSSSTESKDRHLTHGCIVRASRGKYQFVQTVRFERHDYGTAAQYSDAYLYIDPDTDRVHLDLGCVASHPHMLKNTTVEYNAFDIMGVSAKLDIERRFDSNFNRDQYLKELVREGFKFSVSAWNSPYFDVAQIETNNPLFQAGEVSGFFHFSNDMLGLLRQPSPNCSGGYYHPVKFTITIPPQSPDDFTSYQYRDPMPHEQRKDVIYIPEWYASGIIDGHFC